MSAYKIDSRKGTGEKRLKTGLDSVRSEALEQNCEVRTGRGAGP